MLRVAIIMFGMCGSLDEDHKSAEDCGAVARTLPLLRTNVIRPVLARGDEVAVYAHSWSLQCGAAMRRGLPAGTPLALERYEDALANASVAVRCMQERYKPGLTSTPGCPASQWNLTKLDVSDFSRTPPSPVCPVY